MTRHDCQSVNCHDIPSLLFKIASPVDRVEFKHSTSIRKSELLGITEGIRYGIIKKSELFGASYFLNSTMPVETIFGTLLPYS